LKAEPPQHECCGGFLRFTDIFFQAMA